jgi:hypothetical protein
LAFSHFVTFWIVLVLNAGHQTADGQSSKSKYRPLFLDHFEKKDAEKLSHSELVSNQLSANNQSQPQVSPPTNVAQPIAMTPEEQKRFESHLQRQLNQISAGNRLWVSLPDLAHAWTAA